MNSSIKAVFDFINELSSKHPRVGRSLKIAFLFVFLWPVATPRLAGIHLSDHWSYILYKDQQLMQKELSADVSLINKLIDEHEYLSFDNQQQLTDSITYANRILESKESKDDIYCGNPKTKMTVADCYALTLSANSNTHEVIRSFLQINNVYGRLIRSNSDDTSIHRFINDLYESTNHLLQLEPSCEGVYDSYSTLRSLHNRIDILPAEVRDDLNIEVLRYLTFASAFLAQKRSGGQCAAPDSSDTYKKAQIVYTQRAREIKNRSYRNATSSVFLRKLWWVDMSDLNSAIKAGDLRRQELIYRRLEKQLPPEFLKSKLDSYKGRVVNQSDSDSFEKTVKMKQKQ